MITYFEPELGNVTDLKNKMQELGYEYVNPVGVYSNDDDDDDEWYLLDFYLFAKSIGNIAIFRVANLSFYTDFEKISTQTIRGKEMMHNKHFCKEVNAVFNDHKGNPCYYFYIPY